MPSAKAIRELMKRPLVHPKGYYLDKETAAGAIGFFANYLTHIKGPKAGQAFVLAKWQKTIIGDIFGWKRPDGTRQYSKAYIEVPRKNGKSTMASGIALYCLTADHERSGEVYSVAGDRDQAGIVYRIAKAMVKKNAFLSSIVRPYGGDAPMGVKTMVVESTDSFYKVLSSDSSAAMGNNPSAIIIDEVHVLPDRRIWEAIEGGQAAREQPLLVAITTAGWNRVSLCFEQHEYAIGILAGEIEDPSYYPVIYGADKDDDWTSKKLWALVNPSLGEACTLRYLNDKALAAKTLPREENSFKRWNLNIWTEQEERWLPMDHYDECNKGKLTEEELKGRLCFGGLDLASNKDIASFVLLFLVDEPVLRPNAGEPDRITRYYVKHWGWCPQEEAEERSKKSHVPYLTWAKQGLLDLTPGNVIDFRRIFETIVALNKVYEIKEIAVDSWNSHQIQRDLTDEGIKMIPYGQNYRDMSSPSKHLERLLLSHRLHHFDNPLLRWNASNVAAETDAKENVMPSKKKSFEKIDGIVATIMAIGRAELEPKEATSVYEKRGILIV